MAKIRDLIEIGLLIYPGAQLAAVHGLTDLFAIADQLAAGRGEGKAAPALRVSHWQPAPEAGGVHCCFDTHPGQPHRLVFLLMPPRLNGLPSLESTTALAPWLRAQHADGVILGSICAGAFLLAETGLLKGRSVTTHWSYAETLAERFPETVVNVDKLIIDDGDIITAGGLMAWTDLGLRVVDRLLGPTVTVETARFLLVDPAGREQRFYSSFSPKLHHGDTAILKVQHWLQKRGTRDVTLAGMAEQAGLEERTFLRRFHKATGLKPTEYRQHLCIGKAREMLEFSRQSVEQIAWSVGYEDAGAFRKVFQKVMGLSPGDYRRRFALGS
ncbi:MAG TPA: GlxA family transcriptional regulator [Dongiaceae bacterium]|nr:GlxA family transcriptional regulator [Dongiaceae bacterium]